MEKNIKMVNEFLADISVLNTKLHNIHWNVKGMHFIAIHTYTEELYDAYFELADEVAEHLRMLGEFPLGSMKAYLEVSGIKELEDKPICAKDSIGIMLEDFKYLKDKAVKIRNHADEIGSFTTVAMFEDIVANIVKSIWFLDAMKSCK